MNWLFFALIAFVAYTLQDGMGNAWARGGDTHPHLMLIVLVYLALQAAPMTVAWAALILGILADIAMSKVTGMIGPWTLGYLAAAYALLQLRNLLFRDSVFTIAIMTFVAGIFIHLVATLLYAMRGVPYFANQPIAGFEPANVLFQGFFDMIYSGVLAFPLGYALIKSHKIWSFHGAGRNRT